MGHHARSCAFPYLDMNKNALMIVVRNAYFATHRYARKLSATEWGVLIVQDMSAMRFTWNVETGNVRDVRYWLKEEF